MFTNQLGRSFASPLMGGNNGMQALAMGMMLGAALGGDRSMLSPEAMEGSGRQNPMMQLLQLAMLLSQLLQAMSGQGGQGQFGQSPFGGSPNSFTGQCGGGGFPFGGGGSPFGGGGSPFGGGGVNGSNLGQLNPSGSAGQDAVNLARQFKGQNSASLRGRLQNFQAAGGQTNNCADFVSSLLNDTGQLKGHPVGVRALEQSLKQQGYHQISASQAQPGDVWISNSRSHTEMVSQPGGRMLIGSNNDRPGHQVVSEKPAGAGVYYSRR